MKTNKAISILLGAALVVLATTGCDVSQSRKQSAEARWALHMEQVRLEAADQSLAEGRYEYAQRVLEPCVESPRHRHQAKRLMSRIEAERQVYAQMSSYRDDQEQERVY